ncbi:hypothetical protein CDAR_444911 [Caerostris darwini]|uniref:Uncharacterized protein n=1 Tax=Caerostris darwini TaxID=1538125 RepID=A0AAV4TQD7_9ARAC|nr:hypothetical protein CDAR_444911 [Caerostris darwini]
MFLESHGDKIRVVGSWWKNHDNNSPFDLKRVSPPSRKHIAKHIQNVSNSKRIPVENTFEQLKEQINREKEASPSSPVRFPLDMVRSDEDVFNILKLIGKQFNDEIAIKFSGNYLKYFRPPKNP